MIDTKKLKNYRNTGTRSRSKDFSPIIIEDPNNTPNLFDYVWCITLSRLCIIDELSLMNDYVSLMSY